MLGEGGRCRGEGEGRGLRQWVSAVRWPKDGSREGLLWAHLRNAPEATLNELVRGVVVFEVPLLEVRDDFNGQPCDGNQETDGGEGDEGCRLGPRCLCLGNRGETQGVRQGGEDPPQEGEEPEAEATRQIAQSVGKPCIVLENCRPVEEEQSQPPCPQGNCNLRGEDRSRQRRSLHGGEEGEERGGDERSSTEEIQVYM